MRHHCLTAHLLLLLLSGGDLGAAGSRVGSETPSQKPEIFVAPHTPTDFLPIIWRNWDGHIVRIERGTVTQTFGRDPQAGGRITSATSNVGGAPSFAYPSHDAQGRRTAANTNRGNWEYEYRGGENGDGQLHKATHTGSWDFVYNTDGIGRRVSVSNPASNGSLLANDEWDDPLNRFLSTYWLQQRVLRASLDREAEVVITDSHALADTLLPGLTPNPQQPLREIVHALTPPGPQGGWTAWSITGKLEGGGDPGAAPDRKAKLAGLALFPPAEETFTYDAAGNRSSSARWNYTYDGLNRLTRAVNKDLTTAPEAWDVEFTYDAEGRRHSKTSKLYRDGALKDTTLTTWIWDGWHPVIERVSDPRQNKPIIERKLVWGPDLSGQPGGAGGAGGLLLIRETNHTFDGRAPVTTDLFPLYDGSGNIVALANPQGDLLAEYWYGPFGELLEATGSHASSNPWRWASKSLDPETGLVYFGLRYYDPATGQWLSREPLGEGESLNLYAYCHNDPINRVDVLGAAEVPFTPALAGLESTEKFKALFARSNFPADAQAWVVWRNLAEGMIDQVSKAYYGESDEEFLVRRGHVREVAADYETTLREIIAGTRAAEDAFKNAVREQEAAIKATPGYWVRTVAGDFRGAGFLLSGIAIDTVTVPLGGARFRPWAHPMDQWQDVSGGERAFATVEFVLLPYAFANPGKYVYRSAPMSMANARFIAKSPRGFAAGRGGRGVLTGRFDFYNVVDATKAKRFHDDLLEYYNRHSRGRIRWVDETPSGSGGQFMPESGDILISNIYRTNVAAQNSLLGLRTEELLHFKQIHQRGLLGRAGHEIEYLIDGLEDQIAPHMELNGFRPTF